MTRTGTTTTTASTAGSPAGGWVLLDSSLDGTTLVLAAEQYHRLSRRIFGLRFWIVGGSEDLSSTIYSVCVEPIANLCEPSRGTHMWRVLMHTLMDWLTQKTSKETEGDVKNIMDFVMDFPQCSKWPVQLWQIGLCVCLCVCVCVCQRERERERVGQGGALESMK